METIFLIRSFFLLGETVTECSGNQFLKQKFVPTTESYIFLFRIIFLLMNTVVMCLGTHLFKK